MALNPCSSAANGPLSKSQIDHNFEDLHDPLSMQKAIEEAARCLYCFDAPCIQACPTAIDIPTFIHQISTENIAGAAKTILSENIMGGTCARVCPTEVLCQEVCVLNTSIEHPVEIGALQRHAVDHFIDSKSAHPFKRSNRTGKRIAVIGAGPAGLSCAHRAATLGHDVTVFEAKEKPGGLNEYGLAAYKMVDEFAQKEVQFLLEIGGITIEHSQRLGDNLSLKQLQQDFDATFIGIGLGNTYSLGIDNEDATGISDAVDFIEILRQSDDKSTINIGDDVIVIGAGNTAIDAAVQAKRLGAKNVSLVYRRGEQQMSATEFEVNLARTNGVNIHLWAAPHSIEGDSHITAMHFNTTTLENGRLVKSQDTFALKTDMVLKAIGQNLDDSLLSNIDIKSGKITINDQYQTSIKGIYAGGDAIQSGEDLTVQAVDDGKQAAIAIDKALKTEAQ